MPSHLTSYAGLFSPDGADAVTSIEIPLIQRDGDPGALSRRAV